MNKKRKKGVILLSGGLDSTTLLHFLAYKGVYLYPLAFNYGQKHSIELKMSVHQVEEIARKYQPDISLKIIDISFLKNLLAGSSALLDESIEVPSLDQIGKIIQPITYVPFRNTLFLSMALSYAEALQANTVYYGAQKQDEYAGYWDTTPSFVRAMNHIAKLNTSFSIRVKAPFVSFSKAEELLLGLKLLNIDYKYTWSSYKVIDEQQLIADAENPTSRDRIKAFAEVGIPDPQQYDKPLNWEELINRYKKSLKPVEELEKEVKI